MFNFPSAPTEGQKFKPSSGPTYRYTYPYWLVATPDTVAPAVVSYSPADNAANVALNIAALTATFSEPVLLGTGVITLKKTSDGSTVEAWDVATEAGSAAGQVEASGAVLTMHLTAYLMVGVEYYLVWDEGVVTDVVGNPAAAQSSVTAWSFTTIGYLDLDLTNPASAAYLTCVRADDAWAINLAGVWSKFAPNVLRITDKGLFLEAARSNVVRWSRDLTNAQWVKTNVTVAKDQIGVDGVANSCCSLTATADAATISNTCSLASGSRIASMFVKRLAGTGTVELSVHTAANLQAVTVTTAWTRVTSTVITVGNPQFYIRLGTAGDSIAVDFCHTEANFTGAPSSPIETAALTNTVRAADLVTATPATYGIPGGPTLTAFVQAISSLPITYGTIQEPLAWDDGTTNNRIMFRRNLTTGNASAHNIIAAANSGLTGAAMGLWAADTRTKVALSVMNGAQAATKDGGAGVSATAATNQAAFSVLRLGNNAAAATPWTGWIERVTVYPVSKTLAELQAMTS